MLTAQRNTPGVRDGNEYDFPKAGGPHVREGIESYILVLDSVILPAKLKSTWSPDGRGVQMASKRTSSKSFVFSETTCKSSKALRIIST
jgi:hypothetical protein